jgi:hypothetical protein
MDRARQQLISARSLSDSDPSTAYVVAYDAAKHAGMALLAEQNLRPTAVGGHLAIERALRAQFQGVFASFSTLRRRRHELDYPSGPEDLAAVEETQKANTDAAAIVDAAQQILDQGVLTVF